MNTKVNHAAAVEAEKERLARQIERETQKKAEEAAKKRKRANKLALKRMNRMNARKRKAKKKAENALPPEEKLKIELEKQQKKEEKRALTQQEAAQRELARRELARRHLLPFVLRFMPTYQAGWVHIDICHHLEQFLADVVAKKSPRLMITMPPRHGKSLLASQYFPAWVLGKYPEFEFISTSYAQSLQIDFSRKVQGLLRHSEYKELFPRTRVMKNNEALERWGTAKPNGDPWGGGLLAAGVGGPITGRGAHIALVDDPVKNREEADSAVVQEATWGWYGSTLLTRMAPGGGVLVIQTRWHDGDLAGRLLHEFDEARKEAEATGGWPEDADNWVVVNYPAIATEDEKYRKLGEPLHPERYSLKELMRRKRSLPPRDWAALYQQSPVVEEGAYFGKHMLRYYDVIPEGLNLVAAGDLAISKKDTANYSVFMVAGFDQAGNIYMLDERRGRWNTDELVEVMLDIYKTWPGIRQFGIEKGQISLAIGPHMLRRFSQEKIKGHVDEMPPQHRGDKEARARPFQGRMARGEVHWPRSALWVPDHINELLRFPAGVNDDRVDADAWIGQILATMTYLQPRNVKKDESWKKKLRGYVSEDTGNRDRYMAA